MWYSICAIVFSRTVHSKLKHRVGETRQIQQEGEDGSPVSYSSTESGSFLVSGLFSSSVSS